MGLARWGTYKALTAPGGGSAAPSRAGDCPAKLSTHINSHLSPAPPPIHRCDIRGRPGLVLHHHRLPRLRGLAAPVGRAPHPLQERGRGAAVAPVPPPQRHVPPGDERVPALWALGAVRRGRRHRDPGRQPPPPAPGGGGPGGAGGGPRRGQGAGAQHAALRHHLRLWRGQRLRRVHWLRVRAGRGLHSPCKGGHVF